MSAGSKIVDLETLTAAVREAQSKGRITVHCHGGFNVLHPGHIRHLKWAKSQGALLSVGLSPDPISATHLAQHPASVRAENLAHLELVDYVHVHVGEAPDLLRALRPDIYVKGNEFRDADDETTRGERVAVASYGGQMRFSSGDVVYEAVQPRSTGHIAPLDEAGHDFVRRHGIDAARMIELLDRMQQQKLLVIGEVIVDEYVHCDALGMSADSPTLVVRPNREDRFLGGAGIVARHVAAVGAKPVFLSVVGDDLEGDFAKQTLEAHDIRHELVVDRSRPTVLKRRFVCGGKKLLNVNRFRDQEIDRTVAAQLADAIEQHRDGLSAIVISDFSYGVVAAPIITQVQALARSLGVPIVGDVQCSSQLGNLTRLKGLTSATPSEREARISLWDRESGLADLGVRLLEQTRNESIVLTLGARGLMVLDTRGEPYERVFETPLLHEIKTKLLIDFLPSFSANVVDAMGAGDALLAVFTTALAAGARIVEAAYLGNCASAIEVGHLGNVPVSLASLRDGVRAQLG